MAGDVKEKKGRGDLILGIYVLGSLSERTTEREREIERETGESGMRVAIDAHVVAWNDGMEEMRRERVCLV